MHGILNGARWALTPYRDAVGDTSLSYTVTRGGSSVSGSAYDRRAAAARIVALASACDETGAYSLAGAR